MEASAASSSCGANPSAVVGLHETRSRAQLGLGGRGEHPEVPPSCWAWPMSGVSSAARVSRRKRGPGSTDSSCGQLGGGGRCGVGILTLAGQCLGLKFRGELLIGPGRRQGPMPKRPSPVPPRGVHGAERGVGSTSLLSPPDAAWTAAREPAGGRMRARC